MKKALSVLALAVVFIGCEKGTSQYSIEGKWIWSPSENRADANTMYEFVNGNVYTSYCIICPGDDAYWNSLDSNDRIPGVGNYTFDGDTLIWNGTPRSITFECDGGKLYMDNAFSDLWRLTSDCQ